jgi:hypothetical protein
MKLEGITVLDLSLFLPGPAATQIMADHGARIIKVENPRAPEPTRSADAFPWQQGGETVMFRNTQRGKESIALDLKTDAGKRALLALAKTVDVVVEAFRPGVAARLGIDYATLSRTTRAGVLLYFRLRANRALVQSSCPRHRHSRCSRRAGCDTLSRRDLPDPPLSVSQSPTCWRAT